MKEKISTLIFQTSPTPLGLSSVFTGGHKLVKNAFQKDLNCLNRASQGKQLAIQQTAVKRNVSYKQWELFTPGMPDATLSTYLKWVPRRTMSVILGTFPRIPLQVNWTTFLRTQTTHQIQQHPFPINIGVFFRQITDSLHTTHQINTWDSKQWNPWSLPV